MITVTSKQQYIELRDSIIDGLHGNFYEAPFINESLQVDYLDPSIFDDERHDIEVSYKKNHLSFKLLSGNIDNLSPNSYVIASGCGSGKTTAISKVIRRHFYEGILYCAFTIEECDAMFRKIESFGLAKLCVVLHSQISTVDHDQYRLSANLWNNHPKYIKNFPIIITTHAKFNSVVPNVLTEYRLIEDESLNQYYTIYDQLSGTKARHKLTRKFIFIDEQTQKLGYKLTISRTSALRALPPAVNSFSDEQLNSNLRDTSINSIMELDSKLLSCGSYDLTLTPNNPNFHTDEVIFAYSEILKNPKLLGDMLFRKRDRMVINTSYMRMLDYNKPREFILDNLYRPYFIVFDGLGDFTYNGIRNADVIVQRNYQSKVNFIPYNYGQLDRYHASEFDVNSINQVLDKLLKISDNSKTLFVVPKYVHIESLSDVEIDILNYAKIEKGMSTFNLAEYAYNYLKGNRYGIDIIKSNAMKYDSEDDYDEKTPEFLKELTDHDTIVITYYQCGDTKSVNYYRNFNKVFLLGRINYPNNLTVEQNEYNNTSTTKDDYEIQMLHQLIARTRVRNYRPNQDIEVYYSELDYDYQFINQLSKTFNTTQDNKGIKLLVSSGNWDKAYNHKGVREKVEILDNYFLGKIRTNYESELKEELNLSITLDELFRLIPLQRKERDKYKYLLLVLSNHYFTNLTIV